MPRDFSVDGVVSRDPGDDRVAEPRLAATVLLLRDIPPAGTKTSVPQGSMPAADPVASPVEVFMMRRVASMAFAPSMWVFPGGGVDPRDIGADLDLAGPSAAQWGRLLQRAPDEAVALVCAAVREVFEECGVLLAAGPDGELPTSAELSSPQWQAERDGLLDRSHSLAELCRRRGLTVRADLLAFHARWVTPEAEPRRYDTSFFVALMPSGQQADDLSSEAAVARWVDPARLLIEADDGQAMLLPPTRVCLEDVADARSAAELVEAVAASGAGAPREQARPIMPVIVEQRARRVVRAPLESPRGHGVRGPAAGDASSEASSEPSGEGSSEVTSGVRR